MSDELEIRERDELQRGEGTRQGTYFRPSVDIFETDDALSVLADVPGTDPENFDVNLEDSKLTIQAPTRGLGENWKPVYEEYRNGHFFREFRLGKQIDRDGITASFNDGVLTIRLPKQEEAQPRTIEVEEG